MSLDDVIRSTVEQAVERALAKHAAPIQRLAYSVAEAGEAIGRSEDFVRRLINDGELPARRAGVNGHLLVAHADLEAWVRGEAA